MNRFTGSSTRFLVILTLAALGLARPAAAQLRGACGVYALCLGNDRFQIAAAWQDPATGDQNVAQAVTLTADSGYFWFFDEDNIELTVKTLDGCGSNGFEWVFASGMTNVQVTLTVTDVLTGAFKRYVNPAGTPFAADPGHRRFFELPRSAGGRRRREPGRGRSTRPTWSTATPIRLPWPPSSATATTSPGRSMRPRTSVAFPPCVRGPDARRPDRGNADGRPVHEGARIRCHLGLDARADPGQRLRVHPRREDAPSPVVRPGPGTRRRNARSVCEIRVVHGDGRFGRFHSRVQEAG